MGIHFALSQRGLPLRRGALAIAMCVALMAAAFAAVSATPASAYTNYHSGNLGAGLRTNGPSGSYLRTSDAYVATDRKALAGAHLPGGQTLYANWAEGFGYACHPYNTTSVSLGAMAGNPHSVTVYFDANYSFSTIHC